MVDDLRQAGVIEITPEMVAKGVKAFRRWLDSDEPDDRVIVRDLVLVVLGENATFLRR